MKKFVYLSTVYLFGNNEIIILINNLNIFIKGNFLDGNGF